MMSLVVGSQCLKASVIPFLCLSTSALSLTHVEKSKKNEGEGWGREREGRERMGRGTMGTGRERREMVDTKVKSFELRQC